MRVSTNTLFEIGAARIGSLQASLNRTSEQIASGRRILSPSDDPVAASQVLELTQTRELNTQFGVNRQGARHSLSMEEQALKSLTSLIQDVQTLLVSAGNGAYDDQQRKFMATELRGRLEDLMGIANTRDGAGNFLFAGYQTTTQPFARSDGSVQYAGDQGVRRLQVGPLRHIAVNDAGGAVFQNVKNGNGLFNVAVPAANTGSGVVSMGNSASGSPLTARYEVVFVSETEYTIVGPDTDPDDPPVLHTFVPGEMITAGSAQFSI
ncbi:MAG TPA: flagellar hook-associated protein FlgL, partial [Noviherbaspirillum sp.]|nr:flagellar hook-associated protein FlgL [Noviherbaspirillum sp.]